MPEGPETRRVADRLAKALRGQPVDEIEFAFDELREFEPRLRGRDVLAVRSHGKALLTDFSGGWTIYSHNQLYGRWYVQTRGSLPRTNRQLRLSIHTKEKSALLYSASDIEVWKTRELERHPFLAKLGPDLLDLSVDELRAHLSSLRFARASLGSLLLNQAFIAGNGNYLRSEILFFAELAPERRLGALEDFERHALAQSVRTIGRRAYRERGITNTPDLVRELKAEGKERREYRHAVFGRAGARCYRCGETIDRIETAGRRLYVCRGCQH